MSVRWRTIVGVLKRYLLDENRVTHDVGLHEERGWRPDWYVGFGLVSL